MNGMLKDDIFTLVRQITECINVIKGSYLDVSYDLSRGNIKKAMDNFDSLLKNMITVMEGMQYLAGCGYFSDSINKIETFNCILRDMVESLENKDYVCLSDLLQDEFATCLDNMCYMLQNISNMN